MSQGNERAHDHSGGLRATGLIAFVLLATVSLAGCGDDSTAACDPDCFFGVCDVQAGECVNPDTCQNDGECIPGYTCGDAGTCEPINTCASTEECASGICEDGVCQNGGGCLKPVDCVARTFCADDNTCRPDRCYDKTCEQGTCQPSTGECVVQDPCDGEGDCSSPERCIDGQCQTEEEFCSALTCERGVCGFEAEACVDARNCQGMDSMCLQGSFCDDETNQCRNDLCVQNDIDCGDNGVCDPATGECVNAETCNSRDDCLNEPRTVCIEGDCVEDPIDCTEPCPGNQICERESDTAECIEPQQCETSVDCKDDRECGGGPCLEPTSCRADRFEPNDAESEVTPFGSFARSGSIQGTLCSGDIDLFDVDPSELPGPTDGSNIQVTVEIPQRDVGLGSLEVTLLQPDGTLVGSREVPTMDGSNRVEITAGIPIDLDTQDRFRVRVEVSEAQSLKPGGLYYEVRAERTSMALESACDQAVEVSPGQRISGDLSSGYTGGLGLSCAAGSGETAQDLYRLSVNEPTQLRFDVSSESGTEASLAVLETCGNAGAEVLCRSGAVGGEDPDRVVGPGTYTVAVQAAEGQAGPYELVFQEVARTQCSRETNYCSDGQTSQYCRPDGSGFEAISCDRGCKPSTGECAPPMGDICGDAYQVTMSQGRRADFRLLEDRYGIEPGGCLGDNPRTGGADKAYRVVVPPGFAITVTAFFPEDVRGSVYLVEDCGSTNGSCLAGGQGSRSAPNEEVVSYANTTSSPTSYFAIVDTASDQPKGNVDVAFEIGGATCDPGDERCTESSNTIESCNESGTDFSETRQCGDRACQMASCVVPNTCSMALDATEAARRSGGVTYDRNLSGLTDNYSFATNCGGSGFFSASNEPDAVYKVTLRAGESVDVKLNSSNPHMLLTEGATCPFQNRCLAANEEGFTRTDNLSYSAAEEQDLYLLVDGSSSPFPVDINIEQTQCILGNSSCVGNDVEYCNKTGSGFTTFNCPAGGCSGGFCNTKESDYCYDAEDLTADASTTGGTSRSINLSNLTNDIEEDYGAPCGGINNFDTDGEDAVYRVDVQSGETITASLSSGGSSSDPALTLVKDCLRPEISCVDSDNPFSSAAQVTYVAQDSGTYYLVADHDGLSSNPSSFTLDVTIQ